MSCKARTAFRSFGASLLVDSQALTVALGFDLDKPMPPRPIKMCWWAVPLIVAIDMVIAFAEFDLPPVVVRFFSATEVACPMLAAAWPCSVQDEHGYVFVSRSSGLFPLLGRSVPIMWHWSRLTVEL